VTEPGSLTPTLIAVGLLMALTAAVLNAFRVPHAFAPALAILRGAAQLAAVSLILGAVIASPEWGAVALGVMFTVAAVTAARRLSWSWRRLAVVAGSMAAGVLA
jgi:putative ABC transport system permease protein